MGFSLILCGIAGRFVADDALSASQRLQWGDVLIAFVWISIQFSISGFPADFPSLVSYFCIRQPLELLGWWHHGLSQPRVRSHSRASFDSRFWSFVFSSFSIALSSSWWSFLCYWLVNRKWCHRRLWVRFSDSMCKNWLSFSVTPFLFNAIGYWTFILFALLNFASIPIIWAFYPETSNRSLEEIDELFEGSVFVPRARKELAEKYRKQSLRIEEEWIIFGIHFYWALFLH